MNNPGQWHYVATRVVGHMGAYSPDKLTDRTGNGTSAQPCASVRPCSSTTSGTFLGPWATKGTPRATGHHCPRTSRSLPGKTPTGATTRKGLPLWHVQKPLRRGPGSPHPSGRQGGTPEQRQETRNPSRSRCRSGTPPPAARRVVFHEDTDRDNGGPHDPRAQRTSSTTYHRRRSKRPRTERAHIPTILTPAGREQLAALGTGPHRAADGASS